jgi:hypothetical protein
MERVMVAAEHFNVISQLLSEVLPQILHYVRRAIISKKWISLIVSAHGQIVFCEIRYLELARAEQALNTWLHTPYGTRSEHFFASSAHASQWPVLTGR